MIKRKRMALALVLSGTIIFGYQQLEVALASQKSPQVALVKESLVKENDLEEIPNKINNVNKFASLDEFIDGLLADKNTKDKLLSLSEDIKTIKTLSKEPFTILKTHELLKDNELMDFSTSYAEKLKNVKQMQRLATYISITYNVPLDKAERIVYTTFVESYKKDLEPMLVLSLISIESTFQQYSKSHAGAVGLTQVMAKVHRNRIAENKVDIWSVDGNIQVGTDILKDYVGLANGNMKKALQMYNGSAKDKNYRYSNKVMNQMQSFIVAAN